MEQKEASYKREQEKKILEYKFVALQDANCLNEDKADYLYQLAKNKDTLYNIIENIDELDGLKHLLELNKISVEFNEGYFIYNLA